MDTLAVNEIFLSLQGESTFAGVPCVFVRLMGCNLRCSYCDTAYAFAEGRAMSLGDIVAEVVRLAGGYGQAGWPIVEVTGGEPLLQNNALMLLRMLCDEGFTVLIETNGTQDISAIDPRARRIMDLKCPSSGEAERNRWENLAHLKPTDEVKFVIASAQDYQWAKEVLGRQGLAAICPVLFSWAEPLTRAQQHPSLKPMPPGHQPIDRRELAERILADALPVRFQVQLHKVIWPADARGGAHLTFVEPSR